MQINVETDNHVENRQKLIDHVEGVVIDAADRHADRVTSVEVHLGDVNSGSKSGPADMRCLMEARIAGVKSVAVEHRAESLHLAIEGAADKLTKALASTLDKLDDAQRHARSTGEASAEAMRSVDVVPELPPTGSSSPS